MTAECCPLSGSDGDAPRVYHVSIVTARKEHICKECREAIPRGARYERITGLWGDRWSTMRTCLSCVEIRDHFACGNGWLFGRLWPDLEENFFPEMTAGGPCMTGLSPEARGRLFDRRLRWLEDCGAIADGARPPWMGAQP